MKKTSLPPPQEGDVQVTTSFKLFGVENEISDHDLAVMSDWASSKARLVLNPDWKRAYALIREGSDLLLRRRARSGMSPAQSYS